MAASLPLVKDDLLQDAILPVDESAIPAVIPKVAEDAEAGRRDSILYSRSREELEEVVQVDIKEFCLVPLEMLNCLLLMFPQLTQATCFS